MECACAVALVDVPPELMRPNLERRLPAGTRFLDVSGRQFGDLEVVGCAGFIGPFAAWLCRCKCGRLEIIRSNALIHRTHRCRGHRHERHGLSDTYWIRTLTQMVQRCTNPKLRSYPHYGGRGIRVCKRWRNSLLAFRDDMGERPDGYSVDRIDNDGNYSCGKCDECVANGWPMNCRWATANEQANNRRKVERGNDKRARWIEHGGERLCLSEWAERLGVTRAALSLRVQKCIRHGADWSQAVSTPIGERMPCTADRKAWCEKYPNGRPPRREKPKRQKSRERIAHLMDGQAHHLTIAEANELCPRGFDNAARYACDNAGLKAMIRTLGDHILFQAIPRESGEVA